jgi:hypothetical protein
MPHQEFVGLSKEERCQLPYSNDIRLNYEGYPALTVGYWQSEFKVKDHGAYRTRVKVNSEILMNMQV